METRENLWRLKELFTALVVIVSIVSIVIDRFERKYAKF